MEAAIALAEATSKQVEAEDGECSGDDGSSGSSDGIVGGGRQKRPSSRTGHCRGG